MFTYDYIYIATDPGDVTKTLDDPDYSLVKALQTAQQNFVISDPSMPGIYMYIYICINTYIYIYMYIHILFYFNHIHVYLCVCMSI
jgi:hypothetical protein